MSKETSEKKKTDDEKLPPHWESIHGAIWLIGIAFLFWWGDFFPGILVLVALSSVAQALMMAYVKRQKEAESIVSERETYLPETCPNCGGPLSSATVRWQGKQSAICPYCGSTVKATVATPV